MRTPDLHSLRLFLSVYELRNLTHAARRHNIAPSAVTKRIRELEIIYGVDLFVRKARGVVPTLAADDLSVKAKAIFRTFDETAEQMGAYAKGVRGHIRIASTATALLGGIGEKISSFSRNHPHIHCILMEQTSLANLSSLLDGSADLCFIASSAAVPPDVVTIPVLNDHLVAIMEPSHPLAKKASLEFRETLDFPHIGIGATSALSLQLDQMATQSGRAVDCRLRVTTYDTARYLVSCGMGIAVLPGSVITPFADKRQLAVLPLKDGWASRQILLCHRDGGTSAAARVFIESLK
ncbi:LysR family transcriptional regulator [Rhizobium puerariae]|uniref:LysR family transcriptional regulator n=1 Tax=Rhizobium puerariae TaxID=1585791 RepID=A0ABV6AQF1_9HYPH